MSNPYEAGYSGQAEESNGWGVTGLVLSIVGLLTCGFVSPLGLLISLIGLFKPPRATAIIGTILGGIGTLIVAFFGMMILGAVMAMIGLGNAAVGM